MASETVMPKRTERAPRRQLRAGRVSHALFIRTMKTLLPSFGIGMVLLIFAWPQINVDDEHVRFGPSELAADYADSLSMLNARFDGFDTQSLIGAGRRDGDLRCPWTN